MTSELKNYLLNFILFNLICTVLFPSKFTHLKLIIFFQITKYTVTDLILLSEELESWHLLTILCWFIFEIKYK